MKLQNYISNLTSACYAAADYVCAEKDERSLSSFIQPSLPTRGNNDNYVSHQVTL